MANTAQQIANHGIKRVGFAEIKLATDGTYSYGDIQWLKGFTQLDPGQLKSGNPVFADNGVYLKARINENQNVEGTATTYQLKQDGTTFKTIAFGKVDDGNGGSYEDPTARKNFVLVYEQPITREDVGEDMQITYIYNVSVTDDATRETKTDDADNQYVEYKFTFSHTVSQFTKDLSGQKYMRMFTITRSEADEATYEKAQTTVMVPTPKNTNDSGSGTNTTPAGQ